jgi:hypothetical protein
MSRFWKKLFGDKHAVLSPSFDSAKLRPCPFCGGSARFHLLTEPTRKVLIRCTAIRCFVEMDVTYDSPAVAFDKWNYRGEGPSKR